MNGRDFTERSMLLVRLAGSLAKSIFVGFNALSKARSVEDAGLALLI